MRANLIRLTAIIALLGMIAACQPTQEVAELPTLAVLPSLTPSNTPTETPVPSATPTATPTSTATSTLTPTSTVTVTSSLTPTNTITATITNTPTSTVTPTNTLTFTPVPTNTPIASNTPVATNTPVGPQILSFTSTATNVAANSSITLSWSTLADSARIDQLNSQGTVVNSFAVVTSGSLPISVPSNSGTLIVYRLVALRGGQEANRSLAITIQCSTAWFFGSQYAPQGAGCPTGPQVSGYGAYQQFERGFMVYIAGNSLNTVYGAQNQDARYISYASGWDLTSTYSCYGTVPSGLFAPEGVFAWTYCNTNAPIGGWNSALGFATGPANNENRTYQFEDTGAIYIDSPVGVYRFSGVSNLTWIKVK
ncbi:MAG: hypothetical protein R3E39_29145 [Anaerolineae bacterium]